MEEVNKGRDKRRDRHDTEKGERRERNMRYKGKIRGGGGETNGGL